MPLQESEKCNIISLVEVKVADKTKLNGPSGLWTRYPYKVK